MPLVHVRVLFVLVAAPTDITTLSLHDALPISRSTPWPRSGAAVSRTAIRKRLRSRLSPEKGSTSSGPASPNGSPSARSEEHTSELQSLRQLVCRLLVEKKKAALWLRVFVSTGA